MIYVVFQIAVREEAKFPLHTGMGTWWEILLGREFFIRRIWVVISTIPTFFKAESKIKTSITYVYNKREVKIKIVYTEAMSTTKSEVFIKLQHENCFSVLGDTPLLGAE